MTHPEPRSGGATTTALELLTGTATPSNSSGVSPTVIVKWCDSCFGSFVSLGSAMSTNR